MADCKKATNQAGNVVKAGVQKVKDASENILTPEQMQELLGLTYDKATQGVPLVSKSVEEIANDYLERYATVEEAARALVRNQIAKCTTSGFLSGLGGAITLPATLASIPANITSVLYIQMRMVAALAHMGGFDLKSDQVQTLVYLCLTGSAAADVVKETGIKIGLKAANAGIKKLPFEIIKTINKKVGFRLITKFGETAPINLGKMVPGVGGFIGGGFDWVSTQAIAKVATKMFIKKEEIG